MADLNALRKANPHIRIYSVNDPEFKLYGCVIKADTSAFCRTALTAVEFPAEGSRYTAAVPELDTLPEAAALREKYCGQLDEQIGLCWGHSNQLNALEWHTCNEFNIAARELVLLLAKRSDLGAGSRLDSAKVKAFYLAAGEMIEVYSDTLHFCPCEVTKAGFSCIVGLQRGTNLPLDGGQEKSAYLWAKNKWLIAHEDNKPLVARGAFAGIYGENWKIDTIEE